MRKLGNFVSFVALAGAPALALAGNGVTEDELKRPTDVDPQVAAGELLPFSIGARHERQGMLISSYGGFDASKRAPIMLGTLDATFIENVTLRAMAANVGESDL